LEVEEVVELVQASHHPSVSLEVSKEEAALGTKE
jgi:hypothetical protein